MLAPTACGPQGDADAGTDAPTMACEPLGPYDPPTSDGVAEPLAAVAGTARAGRIESAELPEDPFDLADWRDGDFVLSNGSVAVIVSDLGAGQVYDPYGGRVVGLAAVEAGALVAPADYNLLLSGIGRYGLATEAVGVVSDGSDGGPAVVRATGRLTAVRALADLLDAILPGDFTGFPAAIDYALRPDADVLEVTMFVRAGPRGLRASLGTMQVFFQAYRTPAWRPGSGFGDASGALPYLAFEDSDSTSFAWLGPEGELLNPLFGTSGVDIFTSGALTIGPCGERELPVGRMAIGGPGLAGVQRVVALLEGTATRPLTGSVTNADGSPATDVRVHVTTSDGEHLTRFYPAADGSFSLEVDARAAELSAWREGQPVVGPIPVGAAAIDVVMPQTGSLRVEALEAGALTAVPARIEVYPAAGEPPSPPSEWGEIVAGAGRSLLAFPSDGVATLSLLPGDYHVVVERGPEYERFDPDVTIVAASTTDVRAELERVVPTPGILCADYHIHSHRSIDSADPSDDKIRSLAADGLEIAIRSEHEWVSDYQPVVDSLGLGAFVRGFAGLELTTFTWGHFGVFPLTVDRTRASGGAVTWYDRLAPDVFDEVRARPESPALIINHPRAGGIRQGYFNEAGYDPLTGSLAHPELWDEDFTIVEVFNSGDFERFRDSTVQDWFGLLSSGRRVFAVGCSDSHDLRDAPVGYPRTCLSVGTDDPATLTATQVRDATQSGRSTVNGGIYLEVTGPGGAGPGEEASGAGARASLDVVLRAASHVEVSRLEVIVDGATTETIPIRPEDADLTDPVVRARATLEVDVAPTGSWVVLHAAGDAAFDANGHRPFVVSNPIFLTR